MQPQNNMSAILAEPEFLCLRIQEVSSLRVQTLRPGFCESEYNEVPGVDSRHDRILCWGKGGDRSRRVRIRKKGQGLKQPRCYRSGPPRRQLEQQLVALVGIEPQ